MFTPTVILVLLPNAHPNNAHPNTPPTANHFIEKISATCIVHARYANALNYYC